MCTLSIGRLSTAVLGWSPLKTDGVLVAVGVAVGVIVDPRPKHTAAEAMRGARARMQVARGMRIQRRQSSNQRRCLLRRQPMHGGAQRRQRSDWGCRLP